MPSARFEGKKRRRLDVAIEKTNSAIWSHDGNVPAFRIANIKIAVWCKCQSDGPNESRRENSRCTGRRKFVNVMAELGDINVVGSVDRDSLGYVYPAGERAPAPRGSKLINLTAVGVRGQQVAGVVEGQCCWPPQTG